MACGPLQSPEKLHQGAHSQLYRARDEKNQRSVIVKQAASSKQASRLLHEYTLLRDLKLKTVPEVLDYQQLEQHDALVFADNHSVSLRQWLLTERPEFNGRLTAALNITQAIGQVHDQGIIHKQITPDNILVHPDSLAVQIIDFSLSTRLKREHPSFQETLSGKQNLVYIAPEQSGRINRVIDYRSDYYSLGCTLYEMFTGAPPFSATDPSELIHCHLARQPVEPYIQNTSLPETLSHIIMKMLEKDASQRYQSCVGICYDLQQSLEQARNHNTHPFSIGLQDLSERFELPQKLYGRQQSIATLKGCFDSVCRGDQALALVSGYAGVGKSSAVHEIRHYIVQHNGFFAAGKFDQYHRNRPYSAIYQALQSLTRQLLSQSDEQVQHWRSALQNAVGSNAQVLFRLIPELELILGKQVDAPTLSPSEEQHRFSHIIRQILKVFATAEHPLVLFFDDLHWADLSSLKLLEKLAHNPQHPHLLIIGSFRKQNLRSNHPLKLTINNLQNSPVEVRSLEIQPLEAADIMQMLADTLGNSSESCQALADICHEKTQGNPFFLNQFLLDLHEQELIFFRNNQWQWDQPAIKRSDITANVVEFMVDKLQRLPEDTQILLKTAACIGNPFSLQVLSEVCQLSRENTANTLWRALNEGLLQPLQSGEQFLQSSGESDTRFRFIHDRVQQAAYSLIDEAELTQLHYQIGNVLKQNLPQGQRGRRQFDITNHLNQAQSLISSDNERLQLAHLNLQTGIRARESAAFESAFEYFSHGLQIVHSGDWQQSTELMAELHKHAAETAYIRADFSTMEKLISDALPYCTDLETRVELEELQIQSLVAQNRFDDALQLALQLLEKLQIHLPKTPSNQAINFSLIKTHLLLRRYSDEQILDMKQMERVETRAAMSLLANMFGVVKFSSSGLRPMVMAKEVELTLRYGLSNESAMAFAGYGGVLCGKYLHIKQGYRLGVLATRLSATLSPQTEHRPKSLHNTYIRHYAEPLKACTTELYDSHLKALETGDIEWSAYSLAAYIQYDFFLNPDLKQVAEGIRQYVLQLEESGQKQSLQYTLMTQQTVTSLLQADTPAGLDGAYYSEQEMLTEHQAHNHKTAICLHYYYKTLLIFLHGDYPQAEHFCLKATEYAPYISGTYTAPYLSFLDALINLRLLSQTSVLEQGQRLKRVKRYLKAASSLSKHCPENHLHHLNLIQAMLLTHEQKYSAAIDFYDKSISAAREQGFILDHALALELTAISYQQWGKETLFEHYLQQAYSAYSHWGALSKTRQLEQIYPFLRQPLNLSATPGDTTALPDEQSNARYDIASVIQASQAISDEIMLEPLLSKLIRLAIINAGAQRAVLLLNHNSLVISAEATMEQEARFYDDLPLNKASQLIPTSIMHYVARTKENVVLGNASKHEMFQQDLYIQQHKPLSLLALPILYHNELTAILYLENNQSSDVFDRNRLETLQVLASQAAISIENAKLYQSLEQSEYDYKSLFLNAVEGIFRASPDGRFISANPALANLLGYNNREEFDAAITDIATQCFYDDESLQTFLNTLDKDQKVINFETRWRMKGGNPIYVSISARKVMSPSGETQYYEGSLTDISERKAKEVAEQAQREAEAENEAKSLFMATMSHEIRTPMNGILGMAQLLQKGDLSDQQREQIDSIYSAGQSLLSILNNILDYSKIESGQLEQELTPFLVQEVLDETYNLFLPLAQEKSLQIVPAIDRSLPAVVGDKRVLNQILMNLFSNALKFTHEGFIKLNCEQISRHKEEISLRFSVEDTGIGISTNAQGKIFQHFTQADSSITRRYGGTGLGLAITKQIIEQLGGSIACNSEEEKGTLFWFELSYPLAQEPLQNNNQELYASGQPLDILLVEDTPINQAVTKGLLESDGHQVSIAEDGFTALSMHNDHNYDLILMDIHLPDMDGVETTRRLRQHPGAEKAQVKVIALTASVAQHEIDNYLAAGMDGVLAKPIQYPALQALLSEHADEEEKSEAITDQLLDFALLKQHASMLGEAQLTELLGQFRQQAETLLSDMQQQVKTGDAEQLSQKAHTLSGAAANFGFKALQEFSKQLEQDARSHPAASLEPDIKVLTNTYQNSCEQVSELFTTLK